MDMELRKECGKCKGPVGPWTPYRIEDEAVGYSVTCDKCGNHMFKGEIINIKFANDIRELFSTVKTKGDE